MRSGWLHLSVGLGFLLACGAPVSSPSTRAAEAAAGVEPSALDALVDAAWAEKGIVPAAEIDDATFLRRVTLDLAGRVPTAAEASAFLADGSAEKRARVVDQLLDGDDHAMHLARLWEQTLLGPPTKAKLVDRGALRNWLEAKFKSDAPWDEMARELVTAEGVSSVGGARAAGYTADPERAAEERKAGVNGATNYSLRFVQSPADLAGSVSRSFMGVQIQCAQCHDHKSEKWTQADFRGLSAVFTRMAAKPIDRTKGDLPIVDLQSAGAPQRRLMRKNEEIALFAKTAPRALDGAGLPNDEGARKGFATWMTAPENPWFAKAMVNRVWAELNGAGLVDPVDDLRPSNPAVMPAVLDHLAEQFEEKGYDLDWLYATLVRSKVYSRSVGSSGGYAGLFASATVRPLSGDALLDSIFVAADVDSLLEDRAPGRAASLKALARRRMSFVFEEDAESNAEASDGTLQQAFFAMNGVLPVAATTYGEGTRLKALLDEKDDKKVIDQLYLGTLGRYPSPSEVERAQGFVRASHEADPDAPARPAAAKGKKGKGMLAADAGIPARALRSQAKNDRQRGFEDLFWALLNSSEFTFRS
jgi:hypothetical protein